MPITGLAFFVTRPRVYEDLLVPHLIEQEKPYEVEKTVTLSRIDFENFETDMLADRWFLEENTHLCFKSTIIRCLLVRQKGRGGGILVVPDGAHVGLAALKK